MIDQRDRALQMKEIFLKGFVKSTHLTWCIRESKAVHSP